MIRSTKMYKRRQNGDGDMDKLSHPRKPVDIITHPRPHVNGGLVKQLLQLGHGLFIIHHVMLWEW